MTYLLTLKLDCARAVQDKPGRTPVCVGVPAALYVVAGDGRNRTTVFTFGECYSTIELTPYVAEVSRVSAHSHALSLPTPLLSYEATTSKHLCSRSCLPDGCTVPSTSWGLYFASLLQASKVLRPMTGPSGGGSRCRSQYGY